MTGDDHHRRRRVAKSQLLFAFFGDWGKKRIFEQIWSKNCLNSPPLMSFYVDFRRCWDSSETELYPTCLIKNFFISQLLLLGTTVDQSFCKMYYSPFLTNLPPTIESINKVNATRVFPHYQVFPMKIPWKISTFLLDYGHG